MINFIFQQSEPLDSYMLRSFFNGSSDALVVEWNGNTLKGGKGITYQGKPVSPKSDFVSVLVEAYRLIQYRSKVIGHVPIIKIAASDILLDGIADSFAEIRYGSQGSLEARKMRQGGKFGDGQVSIDGDAIPLQQSEYTLNNVCLFTRTKSASYLEMPFLQACFWNVRP